MSAASTESSSRKTSISMRVQTIATRTAARPAINSVIVSKRLSELRAAWPRARTSATIPPSLMHCMATSISTILPNVAGSRLARGTGPSTAMYSDPAMSTVSAIRPALVRAALQTSRSGTPRRRRCQGYSSEARPLIHAAATGPNTRMHETWATRSKDT